MKQITRALISVYDKTGIVDLARELHSSGVEIVSTGATATVLRDAGVPVKDVSDVTGFPEILDGRVKSLHPHIHSGILADQGNPEHVKTLAEAGIAPFDLVIINLYPFAETIASGATFAQSIEQIDIGGPALMRGAAKNHGSVAVISSPAQYPLISQALADGGFSAEVRERLALEAFRTTAEYDLAIATWLGAGQELPDWFGEIYTREHSLRYGENPHQAAAIYRNTSDGIVGAQQRHGKEMSFNNYADADAAWRSVFDHSQPCVAIIKHANPCGIAIGDDIASAYKAAHRCDPVSAFGGVVAANRTVSVAMATALSEIFTEVVIAPAYEDGAIEILSRKPSIRILTCTAPSKTPLERRPISGGILLQTSDLIDAPGDVPSAWRQVSGDVVDADVMADLEFAWRSVRAVKSNAIIVARDGAAIGIGMGQVNRVDSAKLAVDRAGDRVAGTVAASDAFFPFADGVEILARAGVIAVVQPGGSVRDEEVIAAAETAGIAMFFTDTRHFSHA
jgi:phosphoribosylaminoimidazolecarboxamide formyltransferase / IMP cyclohydrolase